MAWETVEFTDNIISTGGPSFKVKEGVYLFTVSKVTSTPEDFEGKARIEASLTVAKGPDGIGKTYTHKMWVSEKAQFQVGRFLSACNVNPAPLSGKKFPSWKSFNAFCLALDKQLAKRQVGAFIGDRDATINDRVVIVSEAQEFFPAAEYESRSAGQGSAGAAAPSSPAPKQTAAPVVAEEQAADDDFSGLFAEAGL